MSDQDIFEGQTSKWTWAAIDARGDAWLSEGRPSFTEEGRMVAGGLFGLKRMRDFDEKLAYGADNQPVPITPHAWGRVRELTAENPSHMHCVELMCCNLAIEGDKRCAAHAPPLAIPSVRARCGVKGCSSPKAENSKRCVAHSASDGGPAVKPEFVLGVKPDLDNPTGEDAEDEALQKAKANARYLYFAQQLTMVQYMAIFGEAPQ